MDKIAIDEAKNYSLLLREEQIEEFYNFLKTLSRVSINSKEKNEKGIICFHLRLEVDNLPDICSLRHRLETFEYNLHTKK